MNILASAQRNSIRISLFSKTISRENCVLRAKGHERISSTVKLLQSAVLEKFSENISSNFSLSIKAAIFFFFSFYFNTLIFLPEERKMFKERIKNHPFPIKTSQGLNRRLTICNDARLITTSGFVSSSERNCTNAIERTRELIRSRKQVSRLRGQSTLTLSNRSNN